MPEIRLEGSDWRARLSEIMDRLEWTDRGIRLDGEPVRIVTPTFVINQSGAFSRNGKPVSRDNLGRVGNPLPAAALRALQKTGSTLAGPLANRMLDSMVVAEATVEQVRSDLTADIRASLAEALASGQSFETWKKSIRETMQKNGWAAASASQPSYIMRTVFETSMRSSRAAAQWQRITETEEWFPYLVYEPSTSTKRRDEHVLYYGTVLLKSDPWWTENMPPSQWNCKCHVRAATEAEAQELGITATPKLVARKPNQKPFPYKPVQLAQAI